jgi:hypothetical protein
MYLKRFLKVFALTAILAAWPCPPSQTSVQARCSEGEVEGVTTDEWGAAIPSVNVVFEGVGLRREVKSGEGTGEFRIALPAGDYRITSESEGFHPYSRKKMRVKPCKTRRLKVELKSRFPPVTE